jgi:hypothetical protein
MLARLKMEEASADAEVWTLTWKGVDCRIAFHGSALISRGMRTIALLLRHENVRISYHLLEGLNRRPVHGRQTKDEIKTKYDAGWAAIDPLGQKVFDEAMEIGEAHISLSTKLLELKLVRPAFMMVASWSPQFAAQTQNGSKAQWPDGKRIRDNVRRGVDAALKEIKGSNSEVGEFLTNNIKPDHFSYWYDSQQAPVSWQVETIPGGPWTREHKWRKPGRPR